MLNVGFPIYAMNNFFKNDLNKDVYYKNINVKVLHVPTPPIMNK
jgi:hypothetical protein